MSGVEEQIKDLKVEDKGKGKERKPQGEKKPQADKPKAEKKPQGEKKAAAGGSDKVKKDTSLLGVGVEKSADFSEWYTNVITRSEMISYYDISGCYILRPWSYAIWEFIQQFFDAEIKKLGVQNAYFPLFVSEAALTKEKDHIEGFAPEVAWVTKSGQSDLAEPVAVRPTSETIMYPSYAQWIRSHRDLPLKLNQWSNVVRWEFKHPVPFLRTREFLWQEGHTVFAHKEEADKEVLDILELYKRVYEELLAVPVVKGTKSEKEKFAGGDYTTTIEAFIPENGRGIQAATSHHLGQNFAKMFHIEYESEAGPRQLAYQNSWGLTTRTIGVMVMVHGDDNGLMLPPRVAPIQVVIVPIYFAGKDNAPVENACKEVLELLKNAGVRVQFDSRDNYNPGYKYNHWELRGVPIRLDIGPKDVEKKSVFVARRDSGAKQSLPVEGLAGAIQGLLVDIQAAMLAKARGVRDEHLVEVRTWDKFVSTLDGKNIVLTPWCDRTVCEDDIKKRSGEESLKLKGEEEKGFRLTGSAKTLCIPHEHSQKPLEGLQCFAGCGHEAKKWTLFGRSY
eukprot:TRINITY_DN909_c0_g1_i1.p1 TRINITY_DN909_c0_g1~~TRINITY_DN909_c0_g1_i1.p1  ORF type:complete len:575 (-),score=190.47 TRINITY_DN909_c0_g1_i1:32-1717(-)